MAGYFILSTRKGDYRALAFQGSQVYACHAQVLQDRKKQDRINLSNTLLCAVTALSYVLLRLIRSCFFHTCSTWAWQA